MKSLFAAETANLKQENTRQDIAESQAGRARAPRQLDPISSHVFRGCTRQKSRSRVGLEEMSVQCYIKMPSQKLKDVMRATFHSTSQSQGPLCEEATRPVQQLRSWQCLEVKTSESKARSPKSVLGPYAPAFGCWTACSGEP